MNVRIGTTFPTVRMLLMAAACWTPLRIVDQYLNSSKQDDLRNNAGIDCCVTLSERDYGSSAGAQDLSAMRFGATKNRLVDFAIGILGHHCSQRTVGSYWATAVAD